MVVLAWLAGSCVLPEALATTRRTQRLLERCTEEQSGKSCEIRRRIELVEGEAGRVLRCLDSTLEGAVLDPAAIQGNADGSRTEQGNVLTVKRAISGQAVLAWEPLAFAWAEAVLEADGTIVLGLPGEGGVARPPSGRWPGDGVRVDPLEDPAWFHASSVPDAVLLLANEDDGPFDHGVNATLTLEGTLKSETRTAGGRRRHVEARLHGSEFPDHPGPTLERSLVGEIVLVGDGSIARASLRCRTRLMRATGEVFRTVVHDLEVEPDVASAPATGVTRDDFVARRADARAYWTGLLAVQAPKAQEMLRRVRPGASVDNVKLEPWLVDTPTSTWEDADEDAWYASVAMLVSDLGLVTADEAKDLVGAFRGGGHGADWAAAASLDGGSRILVKPEATWDSATLVHEFAHVADDRLHRGPESSWMRTVDGRAEPDWGDLDAAIAVSALQEAGAELTGTLADLALNRPDAMDAAWKRIARAEPTATKPGDKLLDALLDWQYGASAALVGARHRPGESLDETLERAWSGFSFTTRELIAPRSEAVPSELWSEAMTRMTRLREAGALSGTRVGALVVRQIAIARGVVPSNEASPFALSLSDDLLVRDPGGLTWMTRWLSEADASRALPRLKRLVSSAAAWEQRGDVLIARIGEPSAEIAGALGLQ